MASRTSSVSSMVYGLMLSKVCSRSHGQPSGARKRAMIALLGRHLGVEHRLENEVTQLLGEFSPIAMVDGVQPLVGFFQVEGLDAVEGLFAVPRADLRQHQA